MQYNNELQNRIYNLAKTYNTNELKTQYLIQKDKIIHPKSADEFNQDLAIFRVIVDLLKEKAITVETPPCPIQEA